MKLYKDGDMWCATYDSFTDLQSSIAGFGTTKIKAIANLAYNTILNELP